MSNIFVTKNIIAISAILITSCATDKSNYVVATGSIVRGSSGFLKNVKYPSESKFNLPKNCVDIVPRNTKVQSLLNENIGRTVRVSAKILNFEDEMQKRPLEAMSFGDRKDCDDNWILSIRDAILVE